MVPLSTRYTAGVVLFRKTVAFSWCIHTPSSSFSFTHSSHVAKTTGSNRVRVRFAPSPTGELHVGGLRTALYNFLFARKCGGDFILRCEDTDQTRFVPGALERMLSLLDWFGITPDEGPRVGGSYGPYVQSEREHLYRRWAEHLIQEGHAYRCFCSPHRLELLRRDQMMRREVTQGYDNLCRELTDEKVQENMDNKVPYVVRFKLSDAAQTFTDLVFGNIMNEAGYVEGDPVLLKSDGLPTYHLANVIDDHHMQISHVLRGMEWQASTPKHLQLFSAFGWTPPQYAHLPLLMNPDGTKLSKRQDDIRVSTIKEEGFEPESLLALLCLTGGGVRILNKDISEQGVTLDQAIQKFELDSVRPQNSVLELDRLPHLNRAQLRRHAATATDSKPAFQPKLKQLALDYITSGTIPEQTHDQLESKINHICRSILTYSDRINKLNDIFGGDFAFLWAESDKISLSHLTDLSKTPGVTELLEYILNILSSSDSASLSNGEILKKLQTNISGFKLKKSSFYALLRIILTGKRVGPPVTLLFDLLTRDELEQRCLRAHQWICSQTKNECLSSDQSQQS